jgi:predicted XRE-type DNA-binding protein
VILTKTLEQRFLEKISKTESGCWNWMSTIKRDGYGQFWLNGKSTKAHRAAWIIFQSEIPAGKMVLHKCDNRRCVNIDHLYIGNASQNTLDKIARFKGKWGFMKLDETQHQEIKRLYAEGNLTQQEIAERFGVVQTTVSRSLLKNLA